MTEKRTSAIWVLLAVSVLMVFVGVIYAVSRNEIISSSDNMQMWGASAVVGVLLLVFSIRLFSISSSFVTGMYILGAELSWFWGDMLHQACTPELLTAGGLCAGLGAVLIWSMGEKGRSAPSGAVSRTLFYLSMLLMLFNALYVAGALKPENEYMLLLALALPLLVVGMGLGGLVVVRSSDMGARAKSLLSKKKDKHKKEESADEEEESHPDALFGNGETPSEPEDELSEEGDEPEETHDIFSSEEPDDDDSFMESLGALSGWVEETEDDDDEPSFRLPGMGIDDDDTEMDQPVPEQHEPSTDAWLAEHLNQLDDDEDESDKKSDTAG